MADLNIREIDSKLVAQLKSKAALAGKTMREFVIDLLRKAVK
jgi:plasmid stability protein